MSYLLLSIGVAHSDFPHDHHVSNLLEQIPADGDLRLLALVDEIGFKDTSLRPDLASAALLFEGRWLRENLNQPQSIHGRRRW
jgi:hypothetical protein